MADVKLVTPDSQIQSGIHIDILSGAYMRWSWVNMKMDELNARRALTTAAWSFIDGYRRCTAYRHPKEGPSSQTATY